jgi:transcriptional regulator with XRE-family HTH domain
VDETFAVLLRTYREAAGRSQKALADATDIDQSYIARLEKGNRTPPGRPLVVALADALQLADADRQRLLRAAGHASDWSLTLPPDDATVLAVTGFLTDPMVSDGARDDFRAAVALLLRRWQRGESTEG